MEIKLSDNEIREILAEALKEKMSHTIGIDPDACWFEAKASEYDESTENMNDIYAVKFCYNTEE